MAIHADKYLILERRIERLESIIRDNKYKFEDSSAFAQSLKNALRDQLDDGRELKCIPRKQNIYVDIKDRVDDDDYYTDSELHLSCYTVTLTDDGFIVAAIDPRYNFNSKRVICRCVSIEEAARAIINNERKYL